MGLFKKKKVTKEEIVEEIKSFFSGGDTYSICGQFLFKLNSLSEVEIEAYKEVMVDPKFLRLNMERSNHESLNSWQRYLKDLKECELQGYCSRETIYGLYELLAKDNVYLFTILDSHNLIDRAFAEGYIYSHADNVELQKICESNKYFKSIYEKAVELSKFRNGSIKLDNVKNEYFLDENFARRVMLVVADRIEEKFAEYSQEDVNERISAAVEKMQQKVDEKRLSALKQLQQDLENNEDQTEEVGGENQIQLLEEEQARREAALKRDQQILADVGDM